MQKEKIKILSEAAWPLIKYRIKTVNVTLNTPGLQNADCVR